MVWLYVLLSVLAFCAIGFLLAALIVYRIAFFVPKKERDDHYHLPPGPQFEAEREKMLALIRAQEKIPFERVFTTGYDGTTLSGRYYHVRDGAPLQIQFHGYRGTSVRDFCGGNKLARENGYNTLVVDQRAHGLSAGHTITFGVKERYDCKRWVEYAITRFGHGTPITLAGVSMGAATVLMASELDLPENVKGIIADSPYTTPKEILLRVCRDNHIPTPLAYPLLYVGARVFGGFDWNAASAVEAVKHTRIPILLIHGEDDRFVPKEMSAEIEHACAGYVRRVTFPEAGHGISYIADPEGYANAAMSFLKFCEEA